MAITYSWKIDTVGSLSTKDGKSDVIKYVDIEKLIQEKTTPKIVNKQLSN